MRVFLDTNILLDIIEGRQALTMFALINIDEFGNHVVYRLIEK